LAQTAAENAKAAAEIAQGKANTSATNAATSESNAQASASAAAGSANAAATSASDAAKAQAAAEAAQAAAEASNTSATAIANEAKASAEAAVGTANAAKATAEKAIQDVANIADNGLILSKSADNKVSVDWDSTVVFVFNCGGAFDNVDTPAATSYTMRATTPAVSSGSDGVFELNGSPDNFTGVEIDGKKVDSQYYNVQ
jgi:hypothetical protein